MGPSSWDHFAGSCPPWGTGRCRSVSFNILENKNITLNSSSSKTYQKGAFYQKLVRFFGLFLTKCLSSKRAQIHFFKGLFFSSLALLFVDFLCAVTALFTFSYKFITNHSFSWKSSTFLSCLNFPAFELFDKIFSKFIFSWNCGLKKWRVSLKINWNTMHWWHTGQAIWQVEVTRHLRNQQPPRNARGHLWDRGRRHGSHCNRRCLWTKVNSCHEHL